MWSSTLQHHSNGRLRVIHVARSTLGHQLNELGAAVVIADIQRDGHTLAAPTTQDGKAQHPADVNYAELGIRDIIPSK